MAVNLNTSMSGAGEDIKKQIEKENNLKFKVIKYGFIALAVGFTVKTGIGVWGNYNAVQELDAQIAQKQASFDSLKSEVEAWHAEHDKASTNLDEETGKVVSEVQLPSARDFGIEAASLQNKLLDNGGLLHDESERLNELVTGRYGSGQAWFGGTLPAGSVEWSFSTWYDGEANVEAYECVWECWRTEAGTDYLVAMAIGTYNVQRENFTVDTVYVTSFGTMLLQNGSIRADHSNETIDDGGVSGMLGELTGGGTVSGNDVDDNGNNADNDGSAGNSGGSEDESDNNDDDIQDDSSDSGSSSGNSSESTDPNNDDGSEGPSVF